MAKGKRRKKDMLAKAKRQGRKADVAKAGGKSKYAQKSERAKRGLYSKNSPFYLSPEERAALEGGSS
jgi:hypothetical protein